MNIRPLATNDLANLTQIRPRYVAHSVLALRRRGQFPSLNWHLEEVAIDPPFDKGDLYDFYPSVQAEIAARMARAGEFCGQVAEHDERLIAVLDMELQRWNNTAFIWNLMVDQDFRGQGIGRRLWQIAHQAAQTWQVRAITLETQHTNVAACRFYAQMGCQLVGFNEVLYDNASEAGDSVQVTPEIALFWAFQF